MLRPVLFALGALLAGVPTLAVSVESPAIPKGIVPDPCPPEPPVTQHFRDLLERFFAPGKLSPDFFKSLAQDPELQGRMSAQRERAQHDWANLCRYRTENQAAVKARSARVVYLGDSITENWQLADPAMYSAVVLDRGISGQTSPQVLLRFYSDVVAVHPRVVHLMVGTNDIAGNTGPSAPGDFENNVSAMLDIAAAHHIQVVLAAIPPSRLLGWSGVDPRPQLVRLNGWLRDEAARRHLEFVDYGSVLAATDGGMLDAYSNDGVHPNRAGYALMRPLAEAAVRRAMKET
jgi:lysophospholipase L1-like esterase